MPDHRTPPAGGAAHTPWVVAPDGPAMSSDLVFRLARERDHLFLLHETTTAAERAPSLEAKLRVFLASVLRVGFRRGTITVRDADLEPTLIIAAGLNDAEEAELRAQPTAGVVWRGRLQRLEPFRVSESFYLDARDPWIASEFGNALPSAMEPRDGGDWSPRDALLVPLRGAGREIAGTLTLDDPVDRARPTLDQIRTVELYAAQIGLLVERVRLQEDRDREQRLSGALADVARAVNESLKPAEVRQLIVRHAIAVLKCEGAALSLLDGDMVDCVAGAGSGAVLAGLRIPPAALTARALRTGVAAISNDYQQEPSPDAGVLGRMRPKRALVVPLVSRTGPIGVLSAIDRAQPFTESDAEFLQRMADQVAMAVVNATLFDEVATLAERYRRVVATTRDAIVITDTRRRIVFANPAAEELFALPPGVQPSMDLLVPPEHQDTVREHERRAFAGEPQRYESVVLQPDGTLRLVAVATAPLYEQGEITGIVATLRDVTDERRARDAEAQSAARYTRLVESASDAIFTTDADGILTSVNRAMERATGHVRDVLLGTSFAALLDPRDVETVVATLRHTAAGERSRAALRYLAADGNTRHGSLLATPVYEGGCLTGILGIVRDVTDEKRLAEQLLQQEKLAAVGQLVSGVAHELNNPLAGVMAFSQLLMAADAPPDQHQAVATIHAEAKRAAKIVANLLTFARQHQPERTVTDLNRIVEATLDLQRYTLRTNQVDVVLALDPSLPCTWGDPHQLQQVIVNLVANAEHALADWRGLRRIRVSTSCDSGMLQVCIADTGPGIPSQDLGRVFNPFFTTKGVGKGTGLGLSISHGIIREHGGRILVESPPGGGATFVIEIPYVAPPDDAADSTPSAPRHGGASGRRILVVDDEVAIRTVLTAFLKSLGHEVVAVASGRDALARTAAEDYDRILLDLRMPDMSGDAVFAQLRTTAPRLARRVVFVTGDIQSETTRAFLDGAGRPVLTKPFLLDDLAALLDDPVEAG